MVEMEPVKAIVKEQIDVLNAIPKRNIGVVRDKFRQISQAPVMSTFFDFDYCGDPHGIFGSCLFKWLHAWLSGTKNSRIGAMILTILRRQGQSSLSKIRTTKLTSQV
jgi:hypothetical protein